MSPQGIAERYFAAWQANDTDQLAPLLAADVAVTGPLGQIDGSAHYQRSLAKLYALTCKLVVVKRWVDGPDIITWFDLHTHHGDVLPAVNWLHVADNDTITRVRVAFDPRPILDEMSRR